MSGLLRDALNETLVRNSHGQVVEGIGRAIVDGTYPPDTILPRDEELIGQFGVSRTVLREAMKTLTAKGMIVARTRIGTRVRPRQDWNLFDAELLVWHLDTQSGMEFLDQLYEMRLTMEPAAAAMAARRAASDEIEAFYAHVEAMRLADGDKSFALADLALHRAIIQASGNVFMLSVGTLIEAALLTTFRLSSPACEPAVQNDVSADHLRIVDAIAGRDPALAEQAMRDVILYGQRRISEVVT
ncbi:DNA-binding transcriptional regulator, FadR family [Palleronia marisminoris]|uniref:Pyruvate dehydrogenase complex repressor n=1 Tax=Palleronia marisminoris TaxID=315423 RepID=A0A1Y5SRH1_9RHOB|nr:FadR/GntR family transcriptional regulator [Palleronia marisminoris]SFG94353.1 DNA-binding transcriptional regulator, FadR family [Palleronia marisminoris]SLN46285.1 Pyruvate dehydrogenase complex repressor [Palleronia marisminoris]